jgi:GalNAc-alpha-(1->4)-GalNAc-alpha-(1->3)-diNAcBac-PP-undecaprenol alpha-1,4-N-acetyl-D-galactosaminyltransferase
MKITLIIPTFLQGGMERIMSELGNYWAENGHVIDIVFLVNHTPSFTIGSKINTVTMPHFFYKKTALSKFFYSIRLLFYLRRHIKKVSPSVILSFGEGYNSFVLLSAIGLNKNVYISDRSNPLAPLSRSLRFFQKLLYPRAKGIFAQTSFAKQVLLKTTKQKNVILLPNPIKVIKNEPLEKKDIILNVGRLVWEKDQLSLIRIFKHLSHLGWKLHIIGEGPMRGALEQEIEKLNLQGKVVLLGSQKNLGKYFSNAKIFAFTSVSEGYPNALCEAMAFPLACISFDCDAGPRDIIDHGINGLLIEAGNMKKFEDELLRLMTSEELQDKLKKQSVKIAENQTIDKIANTILKEFEK